MGVLQLVQAGTLSQVEHVEFETRVAKHRGDILADRAALQVQVIQISHLIQQEIHTRACDVTTLRENEALDVPPSTSNDVQALIIDTGSR